MKYFIDLWADIRATWRPCRGAVKDWRTRRLMRRFYGDDIDAPAPF